MVKTPYFLAGQVHCAECKERWQTIWRTQVPHPICHLCGGMAVPEGPQRAVMADRWELDRVLFRLLVDQRMRTMS